MPIGLDKTHPKQVKCLNEKKHKNRSQTFILHYRTWEVVKNRKHVLVHAVECIIATLAKSVQDFSFYIFKLNRRLISTFRQIQSPAKMVLLKSSI